MGSVAKTKVCRGCGAEKPVGDYYASGRKPGETLSHCKPCHNARTLKRYYDNHEEMKAVHLRNAKARYWANPQKFREIRRQKRQQNLEAVRARGREYEANRKEQRAAYRQANKDKRAAYNAAWKKANKDKVAEQYRRQWAKNAERFRAACRASYLRNAEKRRAYRDAKKQERDAYSAAWRKKPENRDKQTACFQRRRAKLKAVGGSVTAAEWKALKARYGNKCLCCGKKEPRVRLAMDHVIPITCGGPNVIGNVQPLCKSCNSRKSRRVIDYRPREAS